MSGVKTSITLEDGVSSKLNKINSALNKVIKNFQRLEAISNGAGASFSNSLANIKVNPISVPDMKIDSPSTIGIQKVANEMLETSVEADLLDQAMTSLNASLASTSPKNIKSVSQDMLNASENADLFRKTSENLNATISRIKAPSLQQLALPAPKVTTSIPPDMFSSLKSIQSIDLAYPFNRMDQQIAVSQDKLKSLSRYVMDEFSKRKVMQIEVETPKNIDVTSISNSLETINASTNQVTTNAISSSNTIWQSVQAKLNAIKNKTSAVLSGISNKVKGISSNISSSIGRTMSRISQGIEKASTHVNKLKTALGQLAKTSLAKLNSQFTNMNSSIQKTEKSTNSLIGKMKRLATIYLGVMGTKAMFETSDTITNAENKLNYLDGNDADKTQQSLDKMFNSAQKVRGSYSNMIANTSKSMVLGEKAFQGNIDNAIRFQEILSEAYAIGGATPSEQTQSIGQITQGLGANTLQGDELKSMREGATLAYRELEKYAQKIYQTKDSLKQMGADGKITGDILAAGILQAGDAMDKAFGNTKATFGQMWDLFKNETIKAFEPFLQMMNKVANSQAGKNIGNELVNMVRIIGAAFTALGSVISSIFTFMGNHVELFRFILVTLAAVLTGVLLSALTTAITKFGAFILKMVLAHSTAFLFGAAILAVVAIMYYLGQVTGDIVMGIGLGLLALAGIMAIILVIGVLTGAAWAVAWAPVILVIIVVISLLGLLIAFTEQLVGAFYVAIGAIINVFMMLVQFVGNVVVFLFSIWDNFANFFSNFMNAPATAVIRTIENMANTILGILKGIASAIDSIFGSNLAAAVGGWMNGVSGKANALVDKLGGGKPYEEKSKLAKDLQGKLDSFVTDHTVNFENAWTAGKSKGNSMHDNIGNSLKGLTDKFGGLGGSGSADDVGALTTGLNPALGSALGDIGKGVGDIGKNTGKMAGATDMSEEDLKYLRQIAEQGIIYRHTTADVKVEMTNHNTVNEKTDLDGLVTHLSNTLREELAVTANGVHA